MCPVEAGYFYALPGYSVNRDFHDSFLLMYIQREQIAQYLKQQKENSEQRAHIMVLQMRPHFIYNTMTSIYYLCEQDPKKAQEVVWNFNSYIRRNFTALVLEEMVPFHDELEHTRAYLAVEMVRFEGQIFVEYDTPVTDFLLPSLTLQPIVENAVKHGVDPESDPLHISIKTSAFANRYQVIVEDNGPGFSGEEYKQERFSIDGKSNGIALENIRERLKLNCNGTLTISPKENGVLL